MRERPLCACGCGQPVNRSQNYKGWNKYVLGHHMRTEANKKRVSATGRGFLIKYNQSPEHKENARKRMQQLNLDPDFRRKAIEAARRVDRSDLVARNKSPKHRERLKQLWQDDSWVDKLMESRNKGLAARPNIPESIVERISSDIVRYTGDSGWWRRLPNGIAKNPDFKVKGQRKIIEVFGEYWHDCHEAEMLIEMFHRVGYECLILWVSDIKKNPDQVKQMIASFIGE